MKDLNNVVAYNQSLIQAAVGALLTDGSYDTGVAGTPPAAFKAIGNIIHDLGRGEEIHAIAQITEAVTSGAGLTCQCALVMADDGPLATNLTVLSETPAIAKAALLIGYQFRLGTVPQGITRRFLGFRFTTAVAVATAGKVWAEFAKGRSTVRVTDTTS